MDLDKIVNEFCRSCGYVGKIGLNNDKYEIVISKDENNAGAFLSENEYQETNEEKNQDILMF